MSYIDKTSITFKLNDYYVNVGRNTADKLPQNSRSPTDYTMRSFHVWRGYPFTGVLRCYFEC